MKKGGWEIGDDNTTTLKNKDGEEEAVRNSKRERTIHGSTRYGLSHLHGYSGDQEGDGRCVVM